VLQPKLQHLQRLSSATAQVHEYGLCRVHLHPKRFPRAHVVDWRARILMDTEHFVAVNKPWGVQITHRVDNVRESLTACVTQVRTRQLVRTVKHGTERGWSNHNSALQACIFL
jgi:hypothetical protein